MTLRNRHCSRCCLTHAFAWTGVHWVAHGRLCGKELDPPGATRNSATREKRATGTRDPAPGDQPEET